MSTIDLNAPPPNHNFKVSVERAETKAEQYVRLFKDVAVFLFAMTLAGLIVFVCLTTLQATSASGEEKKWAMTTLGTAAGGLIGYLIKR